jgi:hypothetical protein
MKLSRGVLLVFLLAGFGLGVVWQELRLTEVRYERAQLEQVCRQLEAERVTLQSRLEALTTPGKMLDRVDALELKLAPPEPPARGPAAPRNVPPPESARR